MYVCVRVGSVYGCVLEKLGVGVVWVCVRVYMCVCVCVYVCVCVCVCMYEVFKLFLRTLQ
jgi:hypothetical protein